MHLKIAQNHASFFSESFQKVGADFALVWIQKEQLSHKENVVIAV